MKIDPRYMEDVSNNVLAAVIILLVIEIIIFAGCMHMSSDYDQLTYFNSDDEIILQVDGVDNTYYTKIFGDKIHSRKIEHIDIPFPVRGWVALSICVPIGLFLFSSMLYSIFLTYFYVSNDEDDLNKPTMNPYDYTLKDAFNNNLKSNMLHTSAMITFVAFFLFWMIPYTLSIFTDVTISILGSLAWVAIPLSIALSILFVLKYKYQVQHLDKETEVQKERDLLNMLNASGKIDKYLELKFQTSSLTEISYIPRAEEDS